jgi:hypothetical protein
MNGRYSIRREPEALAVPFGAAGIGALAATAAGLIGLLVPVSILESLSFHLYLDTITDLAKPPLGTTAKLLGAMALALLAGGVAFVAARWFGVQAAPDGIAGFLDRLRGVDRDDEEDAPVLRSADRHPDAPARRPFSAMRDIPDRGWDDGDDLALGTADRVQAVADDDEELLLDMAAPSFDDLPHDPVTSIFQSDDAPHEIAPVPLTEADRVDAMDDFDLAPPTLDDWEGFYAVADVEPESDQIEPIVAADLPVEVADAAIIVPPATPTRPVARRDTAPLDLSAGRLDELIARLEAGLSRRAPVAVAPALGETLLEEPDADPADGSPSVAEAAPMVDDDPAFPHDPALAAALATLRKMNLRTA